MGCGCSNFSDYDNCNGCTGCPGSHDNFGEKSKAWFEKNKGTIDKIKTKLSGKSELTDMPVDTTLDQPTEKSNKTILIVAVLVILVAIAIYYFNTKK